MSSFKERMARALDEAEERDWNPGAGTHDAIVDEADAFVSKAGDDIAKVMLRLVKPGSPDDGKTWAHIMTFKPTTANMSESQLALYGVPSPRSFDELEDFAAAMAELEGLHVTVTCKWRSAGNPADGVWTNITGSRTGESDVPADQAAFSLGDSRKDAQPARGPYDTGDDDIPF
jgi:hypothetical protein